MERKGTHDTQLLPETSEIQHLRLRRLLAMDKLYAGEENERSQTDSMVHFIAERSSEFPGKLPSLKDAPSLAKPTPAARRPVAAIKVPRAHNVADLPPMPQLEDLAGPTQKPSWYQPPHRTSQAPFQPQPVVVRFPTDVLGPAIHLMQDIVHGQAKLIEEQRELTCSMRELAGWLERAVDQRKREVQVIDSRLETMLDNMHLELAQPSAEDIRQL